MSAYQVPLTSSDLRAIADNLDEWEKILIDPSTSTGYTKAGDSINWIEAIRPDALNDIIGRFELIDGWIGFVPLREEQ